MHLRDHNSRYQSPALSAQDFRLIKEEREIYKFDYFFISSHFNEDLTCFCAVNLGLNIKSFIKKHYYLVQHVGFTYTLEGHCKA